MTVEKILQAKGDVVHTITAEAKIVDVIAALEADDVGALIVSADGSRIDGIISERDVVRGLQSYGTDVLQHNVSDVMTTDVVTCTADDRVAGVMAAMTEHKIRHVPVVDDGKLCGIISIGDVIKLRLDEVQSEADAMRRYITTGS